MKFGNRARAENRDRQSLDERGPCHWGGRRFGAGRKRGFGKWGEETVVIRVPKSRVEEIMTLLEKAKPIEMI